MTTVTYQQTQLTFQKSFEKIMFCKNVIYIYNDIDPYKIKSAEEIMHIKLSKKYHEEPVIDSIS